MSQHDPRRHLVDRPLGPLGRLVSRRPSVVLAIVLLLTVGLSLLAAQAPVATNADGMAPDNPEVAAAQTLDDHFGDDREHVIQLLVTAEPGALSGRAGLVTADTIEAAIRASPAGDHLDDQDGRPGVVSWLFPVQASADAVAGGPASDVEVVDAYHGALEQLPDEQAGLASALLPVDAQLDDAERSLVLVFLDVDHLLPDDGQAAWEELQELEVSLADAVGAADLPASVDVEAVSMPLMFAELDDFDDELDRLFASAFGIIIVLLLFVYWTRPELGMNRRRAGRRSVADMLLSMAAIIMAILWMQGVATLLGPDHLALIGPMSQFAQVIPVLLIGLGVDYAIHLNSRYREEVGSGRTVGGGVQGAVTTVGAALVLATVTTALGFLTNLLNPIPDLQDFGILAAVGIVSAFVLTLTFVPAVRLLLDRRAERLGRLPKAALGRTSTRLLPDLMSRTAVLARRWPIPTVAVTLLLAGLGAVGVSQLETHYSDTDMIPEDSPVLAAMDDIGEHFDGGFDESTEVLLSGELATPATHNALVAAHEELHAVDDVARRGDQPAVQSPVTLLAQLVTPGPDGQPAAPELAEVAAAEGIDEDLTFPLDADVAELYTVMLEAQPDAAGQVLSVDDEGVITHARMGLQTTAGEERSAPLSQALDEVLAPVESAGATAVVTSQTIIMDVIIEELQRSQISSMAVTLAVAMLLLAAVFAYEHRRPMLGVITVLPVGLVVLWTFGMMALTDIPFGPITATIAALAIGIGLPYTIHITSRFLEDRRQHADVGTAITSTVRHTGGAMAGSAVTTMAGFGILVTSSLLPFRQLGLVTVYAVGFALLAATLALPSMLVLWDRWHRRRSPSTEPPAETARELVDA